MFNDEGVVGYLNHPDSHLHDEACSGFFITLAPIPSLNRNFMVVGKLLSNVRELRDELKQHDLGTIRIQNCGSSDKVVKLEHSDFVM